MATCLTAAPSWNTELAQREARVLLAALGAEGRVAQALPDGGSLGRPGLGQREHAPALSLFALDQALVLQQLQRRVHEPGLGRHAPPLRSSRRCMIWYPCIGWSASTSRMAARTSPLRARGP